MPIIRTMLRWLALGAAAMLCAALLAPRPAARRAAEPAPSPPDEVGQESEDSFPASDPPGFTPITRIGDPTRF